MEKDISKDSVSHQAASSRTAIKDYCVLQLLKLKQSLCSLQALRAKMMPWLLAVSTLDRFSAHTITDLFPRIIQSKHDIYFVRNMFSDRIMMYTAAYILDVSCNNSQLTGI